MEMERKKASALVSLLIMLLASFALAAPIPPAYAASEEHRYWVMTINRKMPGNVVVIDSLNEAPIEEGYWNFTTPPLLSCQNITFSDPWTLPGYGQIVNLTVPKESYVGLSYTFKSNVPPLWFRFVTSMTDDGYGWIFLDASEGDVDCHTFSNNTAAYWRSPSPKAGEHAANHGSLPSAGPDGVAGTADDGFGDGTPDPRGSSILVLPISMNAEYVDTLTTEPPWWSPLFTFSWPQIYTTGNASSVVDESASQIDDASQSEVGHAWEFFSGVDSGTPVAYGHPKWNEYVTYVCAWALLDVSTALGDYDNCFTIVEKKFKEDPTQVPGPVISDINCDEICNIIDIVVAALAFDKEGQNFGPDGIPYTGDDHYPEDPEFDARGDVKDPRGKVNIIDIVRIALDFDERLEP